MSGSTSSARCSSDSCGGACANDDPIMNVMRPKTHSRADNRVALIRARIANQPSRITTFGETGFMTTKRPNWSPLRYSRYGEAVYHQSPFWSSRDCWPKSTVTRRVDWPFSVLRRKRPPRTPQVPRVYKPSNYPVVFSCFPGDRSRADEECGQGGAP